MRGGHIAHRLFCVHATCAALSVGREDSSALRRATTEQHNEEEDEESDGEEANLDSRLGSLGARRGTKHHNLPTHSHREAQLSPSRTPLPERIKRHATHCSELRATCN